MVPDGDDPIAARAARYSAAQRRTADVALELFAEHGVAGTSLQMIADRLGVTKAAVYHQFRSKESIVVAVLDVRLVPLEAAVDRAEAAGATPSARRELLSSIVHAVVVDRTAWSTLQADPVLLRLLGEHGPSRELWSRLFRVLVGVSGAALLVGAAKDMRDKVPDAAARAFLSFGVPALFLFGAVALSFFSDSAETGGQILIGGVQ